MHFSAKKSYSPRFLLHRSGMVSLCSRSSSDNKRPLRTGASVWAQIPPPEQPKALLFCEISPHKRPENLRLLQQCQSPHNGSGNYTPVSDILAFPEIHLLYYHILYRSFAGFFHSPIALWIRSSTCSDGFLYEESDKTSSVDRCRSKRLKRFDMFC